jgi:alkylglycerol monooxygenase
MLNSALLTTLICIVLLISLEALWLSIQSKSTHVFREMTANTLTYFIGEAIRFSSKGLVLVAFATVSNFRLFEIESSFVSGLICFLLCDLLAYSWHRVLHETALGWKFHSIHHTGQLFSLPLAGRLSWVLRLVDDFIFLPIVIFGFPLAMLATCLAINFLAQAWPHTTLIRKLGFLDSIFNTPSNHRVHHRVDVRHHTKNYGASFMLWDKLFGTYEPEADLIQTFGTNQGPVGNNIFKIQWAGMRATLQRKSK